MVYLPKLAAHLQRKCRHSFFESGLIILAPITHTRTRMVTMGTCSRFSVVIHLIVTSDVCTWKFYMRCLSHCASWEYVQEDWGLCRRGCSHQIALNREHSLVQPSSSHVEHRHVVQSPNCGVQTRWHREGLCYCTSICSCFWFSASYSW
jgi:hypothetical protein